MTDPPGTTITTVELYPCNYERTFEFNCKPGIADRENTKIICPPNSQIVFSVKLVPTNPTPTT
jgi:hypothetical protein